VTPPDLTLVAREAAAGDRAAFRALVEHTQAELFRLAARLVGSTADAEDVLQDAYVKAHRALLEGRFESRSSVGTWLHRVVVNTALDSLRRRSARPHPDDLAGSAEEPRGDPGQDSALALRELGGWLDALPLEQRAALVLSAVEGRTNAEVAAILGVSEGAVEQRLIRARAALRRRRGDDDG